MTDDLDRLKNALKGATPDIDTTAEDHAILLAMEEFESNFQGSTSEARPTREQSQWWALILRGSKNMFRTLTSREMMMTSASLATIAVAVVITGQINTDPIDVSPIKIQPPVAASVDDEVFAESEEVESMFELALAPAFDVPDATENFSITGSLVQPSAADPRSREAASAVGFAAMAPELISRAESTERFPDADMNPLKIVSGEPVSTFSIDVDTASYAFMRSALMNGYLPPRDAIRTEELINYFNYDYPVPAENSAPFSTSVTVVDTPWNAGTQLLHIGIKGFDLDLSERPPVNLVFLIDTSGSMHDRDKLPLLIASFRLMLSELGADDSVAIVTYAGSAGTVLEPTPASERKTILASLENLMAGGSTAGQAGLQQAYALAEKMAEDGDTSRVILATDGDFNVGISDPEALKEYVERKRDTGVYLSVLGFGRGNYNDTLMQTLAQNGNGQAAYIDTLAEAQKVLVDQIGGALFTIAEDVKIQIEFNPAEIAEYRLIGYETRALNREDFNNDRIDAGEIGAGHTVTAIYEITPVGSDAVMVDTLRYSTEEADSVNTGEYAFLKLRYKNPGEDVSQLITTPIMPDANAGLDDEVGFAVAVAGFGQILRGDVLMQDWSISDALAQAQANKGEDSFGYRAELLTLMRLADSME